MQVQYDPWPLRRITDYEVAETEVELVPPRAAPGQVGSGRGFTEPIAVGRGDVANAPSDLACTTGKDAGYYSGLNVRAKCAMYDIRLPIRVVANLKDGRVDVFLGGCSMVQEVYEGAPFFSVPRGRNGAFLNPSWCCKVLGGDPSPGNNVWPTKPSWPRGQENSLGGGD